MFKTWEEITYHLQALKKIKYFGLNLNKHIQHVHAKNYNSDGRNSRQPIYNECKQHSGLRQFQSKSQQELWDVANR